MMRKFTQFKKPLIKLAGIFLLLVGLSISSIGQQYDYPVSDSPGQFDYSYNTYTELGWTDFTATETDIITGWEISYTWITDSYPSEGSFWVESPIGTLVQIAGGQSSGTYTVPLIDFNGQAINGLWKIWIEDNYGDGGHQATGITVSFFYTPAGAPGVPTLPDPANGEIFVSSTADLSWTFGDNTETYDLFFGIDNPPTTKVADNLAAITASYDPGTMNFATTYYWQVIGRNASKAETAGPVWSFSTECEPITFPWVEDFEGTFLPDCWSKIVTVGPNDITQSSTQNHTGGGTYSARFSSYSSSSNYNQYLFSPPVTIDAAFTQLSFWHRKYNTTGELLEWGISTSTDPGSFTWTAVSLSNTTWQETLVDLTTYVGQTVYIGFHYYGNYLYYVYLDDVSIDAVPMCPDPTLLTTSAITADGAIFGWNSPESFFDVYVVPNGSPAPDPGSTPTANDVSNPYTWSGGSASADYDWYVRADCGQNNTDVSDWIGPETFTTSCLSVSTFPYTEDFENAGSIPDCWSRVASASNDNWLFVTYMGFGANADHTTGSGYFAAIDDSESPYADPADLYTPIFDLSGMSAPQLSFYYWIGSYVNSSTIFVDIFDGTSWNNDVAILTANGQWDQYTIDLSAYQSSATQIRFSGEEYTATYSYQSDISLDDVTIQEAPTATLTWFNLQWPGTATVEQGENVNVYAQCYEGGVTEPDGPGIGIECWIGYSTSDTDPALWTDWVTADYNYGADDPLFNNDEYYLGLGAAQGLPAGTYYYASRYRYLGGPFTYGGFQGGAWDGTTNVSGVLTVNPCPASITSFPWSEGFENTVAPACWNEVIVNDPGTDPDWSKYGTTVHPSGAPAVEGSFMAGFNSWTCPDFASARLESPFLDFTGMTDVDMAIWVLHETGFSSAVNEGIRVQVSTDGVNWSAGEFIQRYGPVNSWERHVIDLSAYDGQTVMIGILGVSDYGNDVYVDAITIPATTVWTGATSNDWHDGANWTLGVPTGNTDVTIPVGLSNYPTLSSAGYCYGMLMESDASGTATLIDNGNLTMNGTAKVQRYLDAQYTPPTGNDNWHFVSPPVNGATANMFHLPGSTGLNVYLQGFDEATNTYNEIIDVATPLNPMQGYAVWVDGANATPSVTDWTFEFVGDLNSGTFGSVSNLTRQVNGDDGGNNLVGNPYPSAIDWDAAGWTKVNTMASIYVEDQGNWGIYTTGSGSSGSGNQGQFVAPGQGFFVFVNDGSAPDVGTLIMDNSVRTHINTAFLKNSYSNYLRLEATGNGRNDIAVVHFVEGANELFDGQEDARKLFAHDASYPQIYTIADKALAANALPETTMIPMGFFAGIDGTYTIEAIEINDIPSVWLEDTFLGTFTNLTVESYSFDYSVNDASERFILHFAPLGMENDLESLVNIYSIDKDVHIVLTEVSNGNIEIFNMMGQEITHSGIIGTRTVLTLQETGYYLVVVTSDDGIVTKKVFIK
ncbi:MAG: choice-of-anchor J domain-containing protein [Bacteroidales bacterium]|nr:choice-of-anchor J domain-containing protein [Bacteroidales bacterium]MCF8403797.1 choice-of-anchor J domain-containing protein [Bacteroidales bacterium]